MARTERILRWKEVARRVGISRTTVSLQERQGKFPKRRHLTDYTVGWVESEVEAWVKGKRDWSQAG